MPRLKGKRGAMIENNEYTKEVTNNEKEKNINENNGEYG